MAKSGIIIEFIGLPASGKSTLNYEVAKSLNKQGIEVENPTYNIYKKRGFIRISFKLCLILREVICHPVFSARCFIFILSTRQKSLSDFLKVLFNFLYIVSVFRRSSKNKKVTFLDQGIIQALWSILFSSKEDIEKIIGNLPKLPFPDIIVKVTTSKENVFERIKKRDYVQSRLETLEVNDKCFYLDRAEEILREIELYIRCNTDINVVKVINNNHKDLHEAREAILNCLISVI